MRNADVTLLVMQLAQNKRLSFPEKVETLYAKICALKRDELTDLLDRAGIIPECFDHDSTEEKLFAKYCDAILARSWQELFLDARMIAARADAADVEGACKGGYNIVGDAKAFRLSRTAKNQKDFKVEALDQWRKDFTFACLVGPYYQFPNTTSQIYSQAIRFNVTLLSYYHLSFLIRYGKTCVELEPIWRITSKLKPSQDADSYWSAIHTAVVKASGARIQDWEEYLKQSLELLPELAEEQVTFLELEKRKINDLSHEAAVKELIRVLRLDSKIETIRKAAELR